MIMVRVLFKTRAFYTTKEYFKTQTTKTGVVENQTTVEELSVKDLHKIK